MVLPFTSLNAVSAPGAGSSRDLEDSLGRHSMRIRVTGSPTSANVDFEGSLDGTNWMAFGNLTVGNPSDPYQSQLEVSRVLRFVRANLTSISGGTSPTATATIASVA